MLENLGRLIMVLPDRQRISLGERSSSDNGTAVSQRIHVSENALAVIRPAGHSDRAAIISDQSRFPTWKYREREPERKWDDMHGAPLGFVKRTV